MARSAGRRFNDSILHYVEDLSDFSFFQESRFMKPLLLSSVLDLRHTAGGRFNPAISQVHFILLSCDFSPFSIALYEFSSFPDHVYLFFWCRSRLWLVIQILFHRSKIILSWTIHDQIIIEMITFPDHDNCQSLLSLFYIASCVHARVRLKIIACESTESVGRPM